MTDTLVKYRMLRDAPNVPVASPEWVDQVCRMLEIADELAGALESEKARAEKYATVAYQSQQMAKEQMERADARTKEVERLMLACNKADARAYAIKEDYEDELALHEANCRALNALLKVRDAARATLDRQTDHHARWAMEEIAEALREADKVMQ